MEISFGRIADTKIKCKEKLFFLDNPPYQFLTMRTVHAHVFGIIIIWTSYQLYEVNVFAIVFEYNFSSVFFFKFPAFNIFSLNINTLSAFLISIYFKVQGIIMLMICDSTLTLPFCLHNILSIKHHNTLRAIAYTNWRSASRCYCLSNLGSLLFILPRQQKSRHPIYF